MRRDPLEREGSRETADVEKATRNFEGPREEASEPPTDDGEINGWRGVVFGAEAI